MWAQSLPLGPLAIPALASCLGKATGALAQGEGQGEEEGPARSMTVGGSCCQRFTCSGKNQEHTHDGMMPESEGS